MIHIVLNTGAFALLLAGGWVPLFDGHSLDGWHVSAKPEDRGKNFWQVRDGNLTCDSRQRPEHNYVWLVHEGEYGDFELRMKVRGFRESPGNSGVQVRSRYDDAALWMDGPQVDVHPPAPWRTGLIYDETRGTRHWVFPPLPGSAIDEVHAPRGWTWKAGDEADGWNTLRILCRGTRIQTWVNGIPAADYDGNGLLNDEAHRSRGVGLKGQIALQLHIHDELLIQYRDIEIRPLP